MIVAKPPLITGGTNGVIEYSQSGNGSNNGRLRVSVSTPNIGHGPMETRGTNQCYCDTVAVACTTSACPGTGLPPKQLINQRIFHKNGNAMSYTDVPAGTMTYHSTHGHQHVDNWGIYTLRTATANPDPLTWPVVGTGAKLAFCLLDFGSCNDYLGHCVDANGDTIANVDFPNFGLGGGNYSCSQTKQGISVGHTDIYYQYLDGMWIVIPPGTCNGNYYIVVQLDPNNNFQEENENNNVLAVPFTLTKQVPVPNVNVTSPDTVICSGESTTLNATGAASYEWSPSAGLSATTGASVTANPGTTTTYAVNGTTSGCSKSKNITVVVNQSPSVSTSGNVSICEGQSTQLTVSGADNYSWSPATGLNATTGNSVSANPASTTTYTVTGTNLNGCTDAKTIVVTVNANPVVSTSGNVAICEGQSTQINASGADAYEWSPSSGLNATTGNSVTANPASTTTYSVTGTNAAGCTDSETITVTVNPLPDVTASDDASICEGQSTQLTASGADSYSWSPASGLNSTTGNSVTANPSITTAYTVTGTDTNNCINSEIVTVTVNANPSVSYSGLDTAYLENAAPVTLAGSPAGGTFSGTGITGNIFDPAAAGIGGPYAINYAYTDSNGCSGSESKSVVVNPYFSCLVPVNVAASNLTMNSALISWDGAATAPEFRIRYAVAGISPPVYKSKKINGVPHVTSFLLSGLEPGTTYNLWIKSLCVPASAYSAKITFTTIACTLEVPSGLNATDIGTASATLNWQTTSAGTAYTVKYKIIGSATWTYKKQNTPALSMILNNLQSNTTYEWAVKKWCGSSSSAYSSKSNFTTSAPRVSSPENINLTVAALPNPSDGLFAVQFFSQAGTDAVIQVTDVSGRLAEARKVAVREGFSSFEFDFRKKMAGTYFISVLQKDVSHHLKLILR